MLQLRATGIEGEGEEEEGVCKSGVIGVSFVAS
jgi:hypothetical protein